MPIFDQGYQHWNGHLSGHAWRWLAVARHGVRTQLKSWIVRILLLLAWLPAIALVGFLTLWGLLEQQAESVIGFLTRILPPEIIAEPREYRSAIWTIAYSFFFKAELAFSLFLVLAVGPNLVSRDLRFNAFPLYFSRPMRRFDYFAGKLAIIGFYLAATIVVPAIGAYLMGVAFSLDLSVVTDTYRILGSGVLYGLLITVSSGTLMLALSSLSRRSIYVGLAWAGLVFLSQMLSGALVGIRGDSERRQTVDEGIARWVQDHPPPPGVEMRGSFPIMRGPPGRGKQVPPSREERAREKWQTEWSAAYSQLRMQADEARLAQGYTDWRPVLSYAANLDRMGDWFLDTDSAWVLIGRTIEQPRALIGPMARNRGVPVPSGPVNERRLAERMVRQFPWYWSAGVLAGIWAISVLILSLRVKSLDRLK